jgi:transcriptional regulator with XRE-family HTH domain
VVDSSAPLRRLGAELRRLRESSGRTQGDVGIAIGRTHASVVNWERGKTRISKSDLVCLLAELHAPAELRKGLEKLRAESMRGPSPWATYGLPDWLRPVVSFEQDATAISAFEPVLVPGLLQTEEYARALHTAGRRKVAPEYVEKWVAARMHRQRRLTGAGRASLHAVVSEAALRLEVGGPTVLTRQLERLAESAAHDNITLQVLPASEGGYGGVASNFTLLHFADPKTDPPLGCFDGPLGGYLIDDEGDVATMVKMFDDVRQTALPAEDSAALLAGILKEHRRKGRTDD